MHGYRHGALWLAASLAAFSAFAADPPAAAPPAAPPAAAPPPASAAPPAAAPGPDPAALTLARELFQQGNELLRAKDFERALELYLRSRAAVPSIANTSNAAYCLQQLGREDEALELLELLLTEFTARLTDDERRSVASTASALRRKVGSLDVWANVDGTLVVDGRPRGKLPLLGPLRLTPGRHTVRVMKDGFIPAEARVEVRAGETAGVDLKLEALRESGRLRVTARGGADLPVLVDGAPVGRTPWEGTLPPGRHLVLLAGDSLGSAPMAVQVVTGQLGELTLEAEPLGAVVRLEPVPDTATLTLGDVVLGSGAWSGRLPRRAVRVRVTEEGYFPSETTLPADASGPVPLRLQVDPDHPRWPREPRGELIVQAIGGLLWSPGINGSASSLAASDSASGWMGGLRLSWSLPVGARFDLGFGAARLAAELDRTVPVQGAAGLAYSATAWEASDQVTLSGGFATLGMGWALGLGADFSLVPRISGGVAFLSSRDAVEVTGVNGTDRVALVVDGAGSSVADAVPLLAAELGVEYRLGVLTLSGGLSQLLFLAGGTALDHGEAASTGGSPCTGVACDPGTRAFAGERAFGPFGTFALTLGAGATF